MGNRAERENPGRRASWRRILLALLLVGLSVFGALLALVLSGGRDQLRGQPKVMLILGCQVKPWGPSVLLQDRLDEALLWLEQHPGTVVVVSGGQGPDEPMTEARAMKEYLVERGYPAELIWEEDNSRNTVQNLRYSTALLEKLGHRVEQGVIIVSNGFHLTRVRMLWERVTGAGETLSTLAAQASHTPSRWKMYVREPLALVKSFLLDRGEWSSDAG